MGMKLGFVVGAGVGYVLGARDGRERYEQLRSRALDLWHDEGVRHNVHAAGDTAQAVAKDVAQRASETAKTSKRAASKKSSAS